MIGVWGEKHEGHLYDRRAPPATPAEAELRYWRRSKPFARFARKARLGDGELCKAIEAIGRGQVDADLGGGVIKQRIARAGAGKSAGWRAILLHKPGERAFFVRGFAKNELDTTSGRNS